MVKLTDHDSLSRETVRSPAWRMCATSMPSSHPKRPVVCFDESPIQLIGEARQPIPAAPGRFERFDYEYRRNGRVNLIVFVDAHRSWRRVKVTDRRTADDFALCMRELLDVDFPEAERIRIVLDNLSTHSAAASHRPKRAACSGGLSSTTRPSTPAGSTWLRSRSACSKANVSIAASKAATGSLQRSTSGSLSETKVVPETTGCSQPTRPEQNGACLSRSLAQRMHNLCAGELVRSL